MPVVKEIGKISEKDGHEVEWKIKNIFSYTTEDKLYDSPRFTVSGSRWYLQIFPNGETRLNSVGRMTLYLMREDISGSPKGVNFTFGLKKVDGVITKLLKDATWFFDKDSNGSGYQLLRRSELLSRRSELVPSDTLTLTCTLWVAESFDSCVKLDTLSRNFLDMFISKRGCDATLQVKHKKFPVHTFVLTARSPVFAAMFENDMEEKRTGVVNIPDCNPVVFEDFLTYLYSGKVENLSRNVFDLYKIADKYNVRELQSNCIISIMANLSIETVLDAVILGHQFNESGLNLKTQTFFNKNFNKIVFRAQWESFLKTKSDLANELLKNMAPKLKL